MKKVSGRRVHPEVKRERALVSEAVNGLVRAAQTNDIEVLLKSLSGLEYNCWNGWKRVLRKAEGSLVHPDFRRNFLAIWEEGGDDLRSMINDDLVLLDLLRLFLRHTQDLLLSCSRSMWLIADN
jgi:hypothetical protein